MLAADSHSYQTFDDELLRTHAQNLYLTDKEQLYHLLVDDPHYYQVMVNRFANTDSYLSGLKLAMQDFIDPLPETDQATFFALWADWLRVKGLPEWFHYESEYYQILAVLGREREALSYIAKINHHSTQEWAKITVAATVAKQGNLELAQSLTADLDKNMVVPVLARLAARTHPHIAMQYIQQYPSLADFAPQVCQTLLDQGDAKSAQIFLLKIEEAAYRALCLYKVGMFFYEKGDFAKAKAVFEDMYQVLQGRKKHDLSVQALGQLAAGWIRLGDPRAEEVITEALVLAEGKPAKQARLAEALEESAPLQAQKIIDQLLQKAQETANFDEKLDIFIALIAHANHTIPVIGTSLVEFINTIDDFWKRKRFLESASYCFIENQQWDLALQFTQAIGGDIHYRSQYLAQIAGGFATIGQLDKALTIPQTMDSQAYRGYLRIATVLADQQHFQTNEVLEKAVDSDIFSTNQEVLRAWEAVILWLVRQQQLNLAQKLVADSADFIESSFDQHRDITYQCKFATILAAQGDYETGIQWALAFDPKWVFRYEILRDVAIAAAQQGQPERALELIPSLKELSPTNEFLFSALSAIAVALAAQDQFEKAWEIVAQIRWEDVPPPDPMAFFDILAQAIGGALNQSVEEVKAEMIAKAGEPFPDLPKDQRVLFGNIVHYVTALEGIAFHLAKRGSIHAALETILKVEIALARIQLLITIAQAHPPTREIALRQALSYLDQVEVSAGYTESTELGILKRLITSLVEAGWVNEAKTVCQVDIEQRDQIALLGHFAAVTHNLTLLAQAASQAKSLQAQYPAETLEEIVTSLVAHNEFEAAYQLLPTIDRDNNQLEARLKIVAQLGKQGRFQTAFKMLGNVHPNLLVYLLAEWDVSIPTMQRVLATLSRSYPRWRKLSQDLQALL